MLVAKVLAVVLLTLLIRQPYMLLAAQVVREHQAMLEVITLVEMAVTTLVMVVELVVPEEHQAETLLEAVVVLLDIPIMVEWAQEAKMVLLIALALAVAALAVYQAQAQQSLVVA